MSSFIERQFDSTQTNHAACIRGCDGSPADCRVDGTIRSCSSAQALIVGVDSFGKSLSLGVVVHRMGVRVSSVIESVFPEMGRACGS